MKNINKTSTLFWCACLILLVAGCTGDSAHPSAHQQDPKEKKAIRLTTDEVEASSPYLTYDQEKNPALCWTEKVNDQEGYVLKYAVFNPATEAFGEPVTVLPSSGTRAHPESMNKIGFKANGTVVALYAVKHPTEENPFAGSIFYTLSSDKGKSWSDAAYLHSDTLPNYGRGYFDLTTLPDGEVGAVWLDGRFGEDATGSALFFAKTEPGKGFGQDQQIGESTCECCRTDIYVDNENRIHVAYRDIQLSSVAVSQQVRDMASVYSDNKGQTFSQAQRISADNWAIEGCPHTGPSLASNQEGLHAVWFTAGGQPGVYYTCSRDQGQTFDTRQLLSQHARHPQMIALSNDKMVIAWEETDKKSGVQRVSNTSSAHEHQGGNTNATITLQVLGKGGVIENNLLLTDGHYPASHPVLAQVDDHHLLIVWVQQENNRSHVFYKVVEVKN